MSDGDGSDSRIATPDRQFDIRLPKRNAEDYDQDQEWCDVHMDGEVRRIRFHDYHEIYEIPGLYEQIFYTELRCDSPRTIAALLDEAVKGDDGMMSDLSVLDVGAGNGMVGEELDRRGVESIVGVDIIEEAAEATQRDRPGIYDAYHVLDLTDIPEDDRHELEQADFNCLVTVAALGFGDIPPEAFKSAYDLVSEGGWIAFNIKEDFIADGDGSGFSQLVNRSFKSGAMRVKGKRRYRHRNSVAGEPLYYVGIVAEKKGELELEL